MRTIIKSTTLSLSQRPLLLYFLIFLVSFLLRAPSFGSPFFSTDEQFYMVVGGRILAGDLPFVDVWDRKPIGIFLLYAFFHLFGPWRFFAYQVGAAFSASLTAIIIMRTARLIAPIGGAFCAALLYLGCCAIAHGGGGQTPVFYNLFISYALYLTLKNIDTTNKEKINNNAIKIMLLFGIALQIKYTVVFEGIFVGSYLLFQLYRTTKKTTDIIKSSFLWASLALLPTLIVFLFYFLIGKGQYWWFSNIESIFYRGHFTLPSLKIYMMEISIFIFTPFLFFIFNKRYQNEKYYLPLLWCFTSWFGVFFVGSYFKHYMLPLFVPFSVICAPLWSSKLGKIYILLATIAGLLLGEKVIYHSSHKEAASLLYDVQHIVQKTPGCVFIYDGPSSLEDMRPYCHLTPYLFPGHLNEQREKHAIGVNQFNELQRVLAQRPLYIIDNVPHDFTIDVDKHLDDTLHAVLSRDYHVIYAPHPERQDDRILLYMRNIQQK